MEGGEIVAEIPEGNDRVGSGIAGIGCSDVIYRSRACALDHRILASGPVVAADEYEGGPEYVELDGDYYRRVAHDATESVELDLEPVTAAEALDGAAVTRHTLTWPGRWALLTGSVTTTYPLTNAGAVVQTGTDTYRLIYLDSFNRIIPGGQSVLALVGMLAGAWLVVRGYL